MSRTTALTFCIVVSLQLAFGNLFSSYTPYRGYNPRTQPYPAQSQIISRINAVPVVSQMNASQNVRQAGAQISRGSELFSFEMFHVSCFQNVF